MLLIGVLIFSLVMSDPVFGADGPLSALWEKR
jgi:hypothetical protein